MKKRQMTGILFVLPSLIGVCIFVLIPFLDVIRRSFLEAVNSRWVGIQNYLTVFTNPAFLLAGKNTLRFVGICIPLLIVLSLSIAAFLNRQAAGGILKTCFLLPMAIPVASVVLLWRVLFHNSGLLNHLLHSPVSYTHLLFGCGRNPPGKSGRKFYPYAHPPHRVRCQ